MKIKDLKNKIICVLGYGREGKESVNFLIKKKITSLKKIIVSDERYFDDFEKAEQKIILKLQKQGVLFYLGNEYEEGIKESKIIIKTPGISVDKISKFLNGKTLTSQTEIFISNFPGKIIGVTGTKGKSTTSSLIYHILDSAGFNVKLAGNIGIPALSVLQHSTKNSYCVLELSSHQLHKINVSPHIAVFLNIYPEHLDYYSDFEEYFRAKSNVTNFQKKQDWFIFNNQSKKVAGLSKKTKAKALPFNNVDLEFFKHKRKGGINFDIYADNIKAAICVAGILKIKEENIKQGIKTFKTLPYRLEYIGKYKNIDFYNDSLATIPEATIMALKALPEVDTIILGGHERNISYDSLAEHLCNIKNMVLFPTSGRKIAAAVGDYCKENNIREFPNFFYASNMKEAVDFCFRRTEKGKTCLLSCASPSFGLFKDYKDRGDQFKKYVKNHK